MNFLIRQIEAKDYGKALSLWRKTPGMGLSSADSKENIAEFLKKNRNLCFAAFEKDHLIGTILCGEDGRRGYLYHLAVDETHRKKGIAQELIARSLKGLKERGIQKCHLFAYKENKEGIQFWKHMGWILREELGILSKEL